MSFPDEIGVPSTVAQSALPLEPELIGVEEKTPHRFCGRCGTRLQAGGASCETCEKKKQAYPAVINSATEARAIKSVIWLYLALLFVCMIGLGFGSSSSGLTIEFVQLIGISVVVIIWSLVSFRTVVPTLGTTPGVGWYGLALGLSLVTVSIATAVIHGFDAWMHVPNLTMSKPFLDAGYGRGMVVLCFCIQPALMEELAFRGVIFGGLLKVLSHVETVMVSALMFMILHLAPARFPHTLALGVAAGYLRLKTKSLYPCMVLHFSHNFICVLIEWFGR